MALRSYRNLSYVLDGGNCQPFLAWSRSRFPFGYHSPFGPSAQAELIELWAHRQRVGDPLCGGQSCGLTVVIFKVVQAILTRDGGVVGQ
jgi:hypothetical protein